MKGEEVLEAIRDLVRDEKYNSYTELRQAFKEACRLTNFSWLKQKDEERLKFKTGKTEYTVDVSDVRRLNALWVYGVTTSKQYWHQMTSVDETAFEARVAQYRNANGSDDNQRPVFYNIFGSANVATIRVTPTPDQDYLGRMDVTINIPHIKRETEIPIPQAYHDELAKLTAGYILRSRKDEMDIILGRTYIAEARKELGGMATDSEPPRQEDYSYTGWQWMV